MTDLTPEMEEALDHLTGELYMVRDMVDRAVTELHHNATMLAIHGPHAYLTVRKPERYEPKAPDRNTREEGDTQMSTNTYAVEVGTPGSEPATHPTHSNESDRVTVTDDGHLWVNGVDGNPVAVYAPGSWTSAVVRVDRRVVGYEKPAVTLEFAG